MCPSCRQPVASCVCRASGAGTASGDGVVRVSRESKGRGGKTVTLVRGLALDGSALDGLAKHLKTVCGSGGTVRDGTIEIQGDHRDRVLEVLTQQGHRVRRAGG